MACIKATGHGLSSTSSHLLGGFERKLGLSFYEASNLHLCSFFPFFLHSPPSDGATQVQRTETSPMIVRLNVELENGDGATFFCDCHRPSTCWVRRSPEIWTIPGLRFVSSFLAARRSCRWQVALASGGACIFEMPLIFARLALISRNATVAAVQGNSSPQPRSKLDQAKPTASMQLAVEPWMSKRQAPDLGQPNALLTQHP